MAVYLVGLDLTALRVETVDVAQSPDRKEGEPYI